MYGSRAHFWAVLLLLVAPGSAALGFLTTIDAPLIFCWSAALLAFWRLLRDRYRAVVLRHRRDWTPLVVQANDADLFPFGRIVPDFQHGRPAGTEMAGTLDLRPSVALFSGAHRVVEHSERLGDAGTYERSFQRRKCHGSEVRHAVA